METLPLLPRHGIHLTPLCEGDFRSFAALFVETWKRIPLSIRRSILSHWRTCKTFDLSPIISIETWINPASNDTADGDTLAQCSDKGAHLAFDAAHLARLTPPATQALIAHELGHVFWRSLQRQGKLTKVDLEAEEQLMDEMISECWGFIEELEALRTYIDRTQAAQGRE